MRKRKIVAVDLAAMRAWTIKSKHKNASGYEPRWMWTRDRTALSKRGSGTTIMLPHTFGEKALQCVRKK